MEDYTYHFDPANPIVLGSHMLEICPTIAANKVNCEVHPLGIGGKEDPVRLVFNAAAGPALNVSLVDLGNRFRLIVNVVEAVEVTEAFPKLPTARALWKPQPSMEVGLQAWILAGGAHHTVYSQNLTTEYIEDLAVLASALRSGHAFVPVLVAAARRCMAEVQRLLAAQAVTPASKA